MKKIAIVCSVLLSHLIVAQVPVYKNKTAPVEKRISDLLSKMTIEAKSFN
ncbi:MULTISPECIES: hypothetical protein [unclassified Flavobacterium]|jgi:hypothetical protein|nr:MULTISPECIES: hypothetical protein [unclassified Flavobacterium]